MIGVLCMNTGTPSSLAVADIRRYLKEFLSDPYVIDVPPLIWQPILHACILPFRPHKTRHMYQHLFNEEGSRFVQDSLEQAYKLERVLNGQIEDEQVMVRVGMRYGTPSIDEAVKAFNEAHVSFVVGLPLYPQHTRACTDTCAHEFARSMQAHGFNRNSYVTLMTYHDNPVYIEALACRIRPLCEAHPQAPLILSYHSIPRRFTRDGDPYVAEVSRTTSLLTKELGLSTSCVYEVFQSRFDKRSWHGPFLYDTLDLLVRRGHHKFIVVCPGFATECTESAVEVNINARAYAQHLCASKNMAPCEMYYIPALGASDDHIALLAHLVRQCLHDLDRSASPCMK